MDQGRRRKDRLYRAQVTWENGYCESLNARFRDELLNGEIIYTLIDAQIVTGQWRQQTIRNGRIQP